MKKWKIEIIKVIEETIEADTEDEAVDIAWEIFSQSDETDIFVEREEN